MCRKTWINDKTFGLKKSAFWTTRGALIYENFPLQWHMAKLKKVQTFDQIYELDCKQSFFHMSLFENV